MKKPLKRFIKPYLIRPTLYKIGTRLFIAITLALLWNRFINTNNLLSIKTHAFTILSMFFIASTWMNYLRLDGIKFPRIKFFKSKKMKKDNRSFGSINDYVDQEIISFDDLDEDERTTCNLFANIICSVLFIMFSLI